MSTTKRTAPQPDLAASPVLTTEEVAQLLRVDVRTVRRWCADGAEGVLPGAVRAGKGYRVPRIAVERLIGRTVAELLA